MSGNWIIIVSLAIAITASAVGFENSANNAEKDVFYRSVSTEDWTYIGENGTEVRLYGQLNVDIPLHCLDVWWLGFVIDTKYHTNYWDYAYYVESVKEKSISGGKVKYRFYADIDKELAEAIGLKLKRGTLYHYRAVGCYVSTCPPKRGYCYGKDNYFLAGTPLVSTRDVTEVASNSAVLRGRLDHLGGADFCEVWFVYGKYPSCAHSTEHLVLSHPGNFSIKVENLQDDTCYCFRAVARNDVCTVSGAELTFWTGYPPTPSKPIGPACGRPNVSYTFSACAVDPYGGKVKLCFDWGDGKREWTEWVKSGEIVKLAHCWKMEGVYDVKIKAKSEKGLQSGWSEPTVINIENTPPSVEILKPKEGFYIYDKKVFSLPKTIIVGDITIEVGALDLESGMNHVSIFVDDNLKVNDTTEPYKWKWTEFSFSKHTIRAVAVDNVGCKAEDQVIVWKFF